MECKSIGLFVRGNSSEVYPDFDELKIGQPLGEGVDAIVCEATSGEGRSYAIKMVRDLSRENFIANELLILRRLNQLDPEKQEAIVRIEGKCLVDGLRSLILQKYDCTLRAYSRGRIFSVEEVRSIGSNLIRGLRFIQNSNIVHGDIRAENILMDEDGMPKISDFGGSFSRGAERRVTVRECSVYVSPERILNEDLCDFPSDIWSAAAVLYEMVVKQILFPRKMSRYPQKREEVLADIIPIHEVRLGEVYPEAMLSRASPEGERTYRMSQASRLKARLLKKIKPIEETIAPAFLEINPGKEEELQAFISMLRKMLIFNPEERITATGLLEESFFS